MKVFFVLLLAIASTCALNLKDNVKWIDISPKLPFFHPENRIINGEPAKPQQFPYQAGLALRLNALQSAWCGGSLISRTSVLTAGHCVDGVSSVTVYLGNIKRATGTSILASKIIKHSGYNSQTLKNDIALLHIPAVTLSAAIQTIPLPAISGSYSTYVNQQGIASGWGKVSDSGSVVSDLQYAYLTVMQNTVCSNVYGTAVVTDGTLCLSSPSGTSTCNGDSGGPFSINGVQVGLTSYGAAAGCTLGYPVGFTRLTYFLQWIRDNE